MDTMNTRPRITERTWPAALLLCAGLGLFLWVASVESPREPAQAPEITLIHDDRAYRVPESRLEWLYRFSRLHFAEGEQQAREQVEAELARRLDHLFGAMEQRVPDFLDWHYSLRGEYTRLGLWALGGLGVLDEDRVREEALGRLVPADLDTELELLGLALDHRLAQQAHRTREGWLAELTELLDRRQVPSPLETPDTAIRLDALGARLTGYEDPEFLRRLSASHLVAGGVMAAPLAARLAGRQALAGSGRAATARGATRAARAGTGAGTGAAVCAPGGPLALGCAVAAGAAAWLATDWLLLGLDETLNREEREAQLRQSLAELRGEMEQEMLAAWEGTLEHQFAGMRGEITATFVPARR